MFHHIPALKFEPSPDANNPEEFLLYNLRIVQCECETLQYEWRLYSGSGRLYEEKGTLHWSGRLYNEQVTLQSGRL